MLKNKAIDILKTFSDTELKEFRDFVNSPFHNKSSKAKKLLELVKKFAPAYENDSLTKEFLYKKLYPGKKFNDVVLRILFSDLLKLAEEFLSYKRFIRSGNNVQLYLLEELKDRKLFALFLNHARSVEKNIHLNKDINPDLFYNRFRLGSIKMDFMVESEKQVESENELLEKANNLLFYFIPNALAILQEMWEQGEVLNKKFRQNYLEKFFADFKLSEFFEYFEQNDDKQFRILKIYYQLYECSIDIESDEKFYRLIKTTRENISLYDNAEKYNLLIAVESCAISRTAYKKSSAYEDLMTIYDILFEHNVIKNQSNRIMQMNLFRNIFYTSVILKRYSFASGFIKEYSKYLAEAQRENMEYFTSAILFFEQKNYNEAMSAVSKIKQGKFVHKFDTRILQIKIYYETGSYELILNVIDSFKHFLKNNSLITDGYNTRFSNFLKYTGILVKCRLDKLIRNDTLKYSFELLKKENMIVNYSWLCSKYEEFLQISKTAQ